ncbi:MAG: hypothetical protein ACK49X_01045 [Akkermansiaceae bacterium]|jgi:hypothetical protein
MSNPHDHPTALRDLQDSIYREKILRARSMTREERFTAGCQLTNEVTERAFQGVIARDCTLNHKDAWLEVKRRAERLRQAQDHGLYVSERLSS